MINASVFWRRPLELSKKSPVTELVMGQLEGLGGAGPVEMWMKSSKVDMMN